MRNLAWAPLEVAINHVLALDPDAPARLAPLAGKTLAVDLRGVGLTGYFLFTRDRVNVLGELAGEPDARIVGTPLSLAKVALAESGPQSLFGGDVELRGDLDVARRAKVVLDSLDIDWEEQLARATGDVIAHRIGSAVRGALGWGKSVLSTLGQDVTEYLQEETRTLPDGVQVQAFMSDVDVLRSDVDRLTFKVQRLVAAANAATATDRASAMPTPKSGE